MQWRSLPIVGCPKLWISEVAGSRGIRTSNVLAIGGLASILLSLAPVSQAAGETLELRNTSPLAQIFGIPAMRGARAEGWRLRFDVDAANSFTGGFNSSEFVFLDGETSTFSYTVKRGFLDRWEGGLEIPWVVHSGGRFDGLIDEFHDLFGLPDGGRPFAERGLTDYFVQVDGVLEVDVNSKTSDLGDIRGWLGYGIYETPDRSLVSRLHLKLPTGRARNLSGSGAVDVALGIDYVDEALLSIVGVQLSLGAGLTFIGKGDLLRDRREALVPYGHIGLRRQVGRMNRLGLLAQLDAHGALFDAELSHLGEPVLQGTLGFQFDFTPKSRIELALIEDLSGAAAADVIFKLSVIGQL